MIFTDSGMGMWRVCNDICYLSYMLPNFFQGWLNPTEWDMDSTLI